MEHIRCIMERACSGHIRFRSAQNGACSTPRLPSWEHYPGRSMSAATCEDGQHVVEAVEDGVVGEAHDLRPGAPQVCFPSLIVRTKLVVHAAVDFDDEA